MQDSFNKYNFSNLCIITNPLYRTVILSVLLDVNKCEYASETIFNCPESFYFGILQKPIKINVGNFDLNNFNTECKLKFDFQNGNTGKLNKLFIEILCKSISDFQKDICDANIKVDLEIVVKFINIVKGNLYNLFPFSEDNIENALYKEISKLENNIISLIIDKTRIVWGKENNSNMDIFILNKVLSGDSPIINGLYKYFIDTIAYSIYSVARDFDIWLEIENNSCEMDACCICEYNTFMKVINFITKLCENQIYYSLLRNIEFNKLLSDYNDGSYLLNMLRSYNIYSDNNQTFTIMLCNPYIMDRNNIKYVRNAERILNISSMHYNGEIVQKLNSLLEGCNKNKLINVVVKDNDYCIIHDIVTNILNIDLNDITTWYTNFNSYDSFIRAFIEMINDIMVSDMDKFMSKFYCMEVDYTDNLYTTVDNVFDLVNTVKYINSDYVKINKNVKELDLDERCCISLNNLKVDTIEGLYNDNSTVNEIYNIERRLVKYLLEYGINNMGEYKISVLDFNIGVSNSNSDNLILDLDSLPMAIMDILSSQKLNMDNLLDLQCIIDSNVNNPIMADFSRDYQKQVDNFIVSFKQFCADKMLEDGKNNINIKKLIGILLHDFTDDYYIDINNFIKDGMSVDNISIDSVLKSIYTDDAQYQMVKESPETDFIDRESFCRRLDMFDIWLILYVNNIRDKIFNNKNSIFTSETELFNVVFKQFI